MPQTQSGPGGYAYSVSRVSGGAKAYICPACRREIPAGQPHVVAWKTEAPWGQEAGVNSRRHWHSYCWDRRLDPIG